jgi:predicted dehydrogenase
MRKCLVVGQGSIGLRHRRVLETMGLAVGVVSQHLERGEKNDVFSEVGHAIEEWKPEYIVVANSTAEHFQTLSAIADSGTRARILVEKPLFSQKPLAQGEQRLWPALSSQTFVGYQLRYHPLVSELRKQIAGKKILSVQGYVGQYLPTWRTTGRPYNESYSAHRDQGGGVLRDLSHELDLMLWCFGPCKSVVAKIGKFSDLKIDSEDTCVLMVETSLAPVASFELNYNDRVSQRRLTVNLSDETLQLDFVSCRIQSSKGIQEFKTERDELYEKMHRDVLESTHEKKPMACSFTEGLAVLDLIVAAETSENEKKWVKP